MATWRGTIGAAILALAALANGAPADPAEPARFRVTDRVQTPGIGPFSVTALHIGNGAMMMGTGTGFEPRIWRTRLKAQADAPDRVIAGMPALTAGDTLREGALDGAEVDVLRIENGRMRRVRLARVAPGGHAASGWTPLQAGRILAPGTQSFQFAWPGWSRPGVDYWFTVRAVDADGRLSPIADPVRVRAPDRLGGNAAAPELVGNPGLIQGAPSDRIAAPERFSAEVTADRILTLRWQPPRGRVQGYVVYKSETAPEAHRGAFLLLEGEGPAIRAGDLVFVRQRWMAPSRERLVRNRIWNASAAAQIAGLPLVRGYADSAEGGTWDLRPHAPDTPVEDPGETYLTLRVLPGDGAEIGGETHVGLENRWRRVLDPRHRYKVDVWLRARGPEAALLRVGGYGTISELSGIRLPLGPQWQRYVFEFQPPALIEGRRTARTILKFAGSGEVDIDNFRLSRADVPYLAWEPEDAARLRLSGMGMLRTHGLIKTGSQTYDLTQLTNPAGAISAQTRGNTLPQTLARIAELEMDPWLQIEPHLSREEWLGLAEFLAAPYDPAVDTPEAKPWAAKRHAQGRAAPWVEAFDEILFEIGNETWNGLFRPWTFPAVVDAATGARVSPAQVYGAYQEYVLDALRESPYWPALAPRLVPVLGGWAGLPYGARAAERSPSSEIVGIAGYLGGWDQNQGPVAQTPFGYFTVLNSVSQLALPDATLLRDELARLAEGRDRPLEPATYEAGPGYAINGLNGARITPEEAAGQERVMKSVAAATATIDSFLARAALGFRRQNYFVYDQGPTFASHLSWQEGGSVLPPWMQLAVFNRFATGDLLEVETLETPRADLPALRNRPAVPGAPLVAIYALRQGDRLALYAISRRVPNHPVPGDVGATDLEVLLPISGARQLTTYAFTQPYDAHTLDGEAVEIAVQRIPDPPEPERLRVATLPPGQAVLLVYEGVTW